MYSFKLANKIRTKLLLFVDEEIRTKANNILSLNKMKDNNGSICEIRTKEELFSSIQKNQVLDINKNNNLNSSPELQFKAYSKFQRKIKANIDSKFKTQKSIIDESKNNEIYYKNQKYCKHINKRQASQILYRKVIKDKRQNPKEYLKKLCGSLINRSALNRYYSKVKIPKKSKITKSPKSKKLTKKIENKKEPNQPLNNIDSFRIILFALDD